VRRRKGDRRDRGQAEEPACLDGASAAGLAGVVLRDLEIVAADDFDGAVDPAAVEQLDPDRLAAACELAEGERQPVAAGGCRGCRLEGGRLGWEGDRGCRPVADEVLGAVAVVEDEELGIAGDDDAAEAAGAGVGDRLGACPAGELLQRTVSPIPARSAATVSWSASRRRPASNSASSSSNTLRMAGEVAWSGCSSSSMIAGLVGGSARPQPGASGCPPMASSESKRRKSEAS